MALRDLGKPMYPLHSFLEIIASSQSLATNVFESEQWFF